MWSIALKNRTFNAENRLKRRFSEKGGPSDRIRTCGILLPKQARYQLRYTRLLSFLSGWSYSPKPGAIPTSLYPDIYFSP
jgi:isocitrate lyase